MTVFTDWAMKVMTEGVPKGVPQDVYPFETDRGITYLKFDHISIEPNRDDPSSTMVCYWWRGRKVYLYRVDGYQAVNGAQLDIHGFSGRMLVEVSRV